MDKQLPAKTLVSNLQMLLKETGMTVGELAHRSGVSKRMIDYILAGERKPSVEIAGMLANAFGLTGWQLILPNLSYMIARSGALDNLIDDFERASQETREYVAHVLKREVSN